ncbi:hypothetical protein [Bordetella bronchiseptica]|nr:hypothetical protein [Bordetella bronchiseptica]VTR03534.1 Uncharacterised protein [Bordetella bronchiseptica]VTR03598.1 Uncharacterised protein [Bordetella bronchiseptica]
MKPSRFLPVILAGLALSWAGSASAYKRVGRESCEILKKSM